MKKEQHALGVSALINIIVSFLKVWGGILCCSYTLMASGYYTICDFSTDIIAMVGAKVGKKRANKKHPFGYGRFEYSLQIVIGVVILLVGLYIFIRSFFLKYEIPNLNILYILLFVFFLKVLSSNYLMKKGRDISSLILIFNAKESFLDVLSLIVTFLVIIISRFIPIIDLIGCLLMALLIIYEGVKIIFDNVIAIIGIDDNNKTIKDNLKKVINKETKVEYSDAFLLKIKEYYYATIEIGVDENMNIKDLMKVERDLKRKIKRGKSNKIKYIEFNVIKK